MWLSSLPPLMMGSGNLRKSQAATGTITRVVGNRGAGGDHRLPLDFVDIEKRTEAEIENPSLVPPTPRFFGLPPPLIGQ